MGRLGSSRLGSNGLYEPRDSLGASGMGASLPYSSCKWFITVFSWICLALKTLVIYGFPLGPSLIMVMSVIWAATDIRHIMGIDGFQIGGPCEAPMVWIVNFGFNRG